MAQFIKTIEITAANRSKTMEADIISRNGWSPSKMNRGFFTVLSFVFMLFLLIGCDAKRQEYQDVVSVSGIGTVLVQPDVVQMTIYFSHVAPSTKEAKRVVDQTMQQILKILQEEKIEDKYIKTISLNYDIEYSWKNGRNVPIGQRAQQTIAVKVNDIINSPEKFPTLLDKITVIDKVEIHNILFDIENKTENFAQSRKLAYQKAFEKAEQYAILSGRKIGKVLAISEGSREALQVRSFMSNQSLGVAKEFQSESSSSVPTGEREITTEINVVFLLK